MRNIFIRKLLVVMFSCISDADITAKKKYECVVNLINVLSYDTSCGGSLNSLVRNHNKLILVVTRSNILWSNIEYFCLLKNVMLNTILARRQ